MIDTTIIDKQLIATTKQLELITEELEISKMASDKEINYLKEANINLCNKLKECEMQNKLLEAVPDQVASIIYENEVIEYKYNVLKINNMQLKMHLHEKEIEICKLKIQLLNKK
jgi:predicted RNase H-like nuclease (RuvC/YqgF family)